VAGPGAGKYKAYEGLILAFCLPTDMATVNTVRPGNRLRKLDRMGPIISSRAPNGKIKL
jgi:hypothetical protein